MYGNNKQKNKCKKYYLIYIYIYIYKFNELWRGGGYLVSSSLGVKEEVD